MKPGRPASHSGRSAVTLGVGSCLRVTGNYLPSHSVTSTGSACRGGALLSQREGRDAVIGLEGFMGTDEAPQQCGHRY